MKTFINLRDERITEVNYELDERLLLPSTTVEIDRVIDEAFRTREEWRIQKDVKRTALCDIL